jgi:hypothetical protein
MVFSPYLSWIFLSRFVFTLRGRESEVPLGERRPTAWPRVRSRALWIGLLRCVGGDEGAGGLFVSAAVELACDLAAVQVAATAEAELVPAGLLFDEDHGELGAVDGERHVDQVFAIAGQGAAGFSKSSRPIQVWISRPSNSVRVLARTRPVRLMRARVSHS